MKHPSQLKPPGITTAASLAGTRILFANFPADGHFNPLTGLAAHLKDIGCDVRWYTSRKYADKLSRMEIPFYPLRKAMDVSTLENVFPEREQISGQVAKLKYDIINAFILRGPEYFEDMRDIYRQFPFEMVVADCLFTGIPFISDRMKIPVVSIGVLPLTATSVDLPPAGLGMIPAPGILGKLKHGLLRFVADRYIFRQPNKLMTRVLGAYDIDSLDANVFDLLIKKSTLLLQSGSPGFEYHRSDLGSNIRFIGSLLPYAKKKEREPWFDERLNRYERVAIVTQGTIERDVEKIIVPTLEALRNTEVLVIATTGGSGTSELRHRFPENNIIIEDFIPFADIMPYADVYITNGGYGGVMLGIGNDLPLVVAGVHEGKNEINARIGYFKLGVNLKTENPTPSQMKKAVHRVLSTPMYRENVMRLGRELDMYKPNTLMVQYLGEILKNRTSVNPYPS